MARVNPEWEKAAVRLKVALAELLFGWNQMESATRYLLEKAIGIRSFEGQILTADMGNVTVVDALRAITETWPPYLRDHVLHYLKGYERLRAWRNYLVHGPTAMARDGDKVGMYVTEIAFRGGRLKQHQDLVDADVIEKVKDSIGEFHLYLSRIIAEIYEQGEAPGLFAYAPLDSKAGPDLPEELARAHIYLASSHNPLPHIRRQADGADGD